MRFKIVRGDALEVLEVGPAQKAGPSAARTTTFTPGSLAAAVNAAVSSCTITSSSAFLLSGRRSVIVARRSLLAYEIRVKSMQRK